VRMHDRIVNPPDPDIAASLRAALSGLAESLMQWPIGAPTIIAPKSYIVGIGPNLAMLPIGNWNSGSTDETMNTFNGFFLYVPDLDNCASLVTSLMDAPAFKNTVFSG
jgi:hypothetical protein